MEIQTEQKPLRLLFIEDNNADAELLLRALKQEGFFPEYTIVKNPSQLKKALAETWDIVFLDYNVPGYGTLNALEDIRSLDGSTPIIVVSGAIGEDLAVEVLKAGADDFLIKGKWNRLGSAVRRSLREKESRLQSKAAQRDREEILAVVSHDLRNPLSAVQLNLQQIQKMYENSSIVSQEQEHVQSLMQRAQKSLQRMRFLIEDILDETKIAVGRFRVDRQIFSINQIFSDLDEVFRPIALKKNLDFQVTCDEELQVAFDPDRIFQALGNVLGNAIKFTDSGGQIKMWCERHEGAIKFYISDTGKGIAPENVARVFERYWQSNATVSGSLGLGLFIVKGIVDAHEGTISVKSTVGSGTTFEICLPTDVKIESESTTRSYLKEVSPKLEDSLKKNIPIYGDILIVDDDEDMRMVLTDIFIHERFKVHEAGNLTTALEILNTVKNLKLVILDYHFNGMTTDKLVGKFSQLPIVLVSAADDLESKARDMGIEKCLRKPIDRNVIVKAVKDILKIK